ncbi:MAG: acetoacetate--CoA ligase [Nitriliruptorales bacterium]|nr:acetoacetate--CoA ligase [Nitriliruptorales bacterium]
MDDVVWTPSPSRVASTNLAAFAGSPPTTPEAYHELWQWSIDDLEDFWARVWERCEVRADRHYDDVVGELRMPGTRWFAGAELNFAANLLRRRDDTPAVFATGEGRDDEWVSWAELTARVARAQRGLVNLGIRRGDRVAGIVPNGIETLVLMLATASVGAVWSSCSPDFGPMGIVDRFRQISPAVLVTADGYRYHGERYDLQDKVRAVLEAIPAIRHVVIIDFAGVGLTTKGRSAITYEDLLAGDATEPTFAPLPFDHPLYVLYSSGTTGAPKSIVHSAGGTLIQHLKEQRLHADLHPGDVISWFTTCGWMMWNWLVSALASEARIVLYDGSPTYPDVGVLWRMAERAGITHFGTSPKFLSACERSGQRPADLADLSRISAVLSTGSPLNPDQFDWVYAAIGQDLQLASVSGGTDMIGCFVGGVPTLPVRRGRLQGRQLGMAVESWNLDGKPVVGEKGELVCTQPFPSMPLGFWGDDDGSRYRAAYFSQHPGVWTHGDFMEIDPDGSAMILGRSDTTLNPGGVRIGTAEIYRAIEPLPEIADAIVVGRPVDGDVEIVLCVVPADGVRLDEDLTTRIRGTIRSAATPRHVPAQVFAVTDVPYTISGKKVEKAVLSMMIGEDVGNRDALANPEALDQYARLPFPQA